MPVKAPKKDFADTRARKQKNSGFPVIKTLTFIVLLSLAAFLLLYPIPRDKSQKRPQAAGENPKPQPVHNIPDGLPPEANRELAWLLERVPSFRIAKMEHGGRTTELALSDSLTIDDLRGKTLDPAPPVLGEAPAYDPRQTDTFAPGTAPYEATGIEPFRFRYFNCEFNYGGWHNFKMMDYASTRGFNIIFPYIRKAEESAHLPQGTKWLTWSGFINWGEWFKRHNIPDNRYDLLTDLDATALHIADKIFRREPDSPLLKKRGDLLMIDMEHSVLSPEKLREQEWYPRKGTEQERKAFEDKYYAGYALTYLSAVQAARAEGWKDISIYGWYPYGRTWGGLEQAQADPGTDFAWNAFGEKIFSEVDIVNNSVYSFYWVAENVAYTLANIDMNLSMTGNRKPVRPYYWSLLHGGGGGVRWWRGQPLANEDARAMHAMLFFTGCDGFDLWNWSGTGNHHRPALFRDNSVKNPETGAVEKKREYLDVMVGKPFACVSDSGSKHEFQRYDALHIISVDDLGEAAFYQIDKNAPGNAKAGDETYRLAEEELLANLRPASEPVSAIIEGLALAKPFEYILRNGETKVDISAKKQFANRLPAVRRVKLGQLHLFITYDPNPVYGTLPKGETEAPQQGKPRRIVLADFDGVEGRKVTIPADAQTRIFALVER
jgi:hypothetical protein